MLVLSIRMLKASNGGWYAIVETADRDYQTGTYEHKFEARDAGRNLADKLRQK